MARAACGTPRNHAVKLLARSAENTPSMRLASAVKHGLEPAVTEADTFW
jgi:hypothetical protein